MQKIHISSIKKDVNNPLPAGETPAVDVDVFIKSFSTGALATIYSANNQVPGNIITQPLKTDVNGFVSFYAPNGRYNYEFALASGNRVIFDNLVFDRFDEIHAGTGKLSITANGENSLLLNAGGDSNTGSGENTLRSNTEGSNNTGVGKNSLLFNIDGNRNTGLGESSLIYKQNGSNNTDLSNCSGLGSGSRVSASNQVQLGDSSTTTYVYGTVQNRSDLRDKTEIRESILGLDFINALNPIDYKWNMREDYQRAVTERIKNPKYRINNEEPEFIETVKIVYDKNDGSKTRSRFHHGLSAQDVQKLIQDTGVDFGGFQDHSLSEGGTDVMSIGYDELICPLINAFQQYQKLKDKQISDLEKRLLVLESK